MQKRLSKVPAEARKHWEALAVVPTLAWTILVVAMESLRGG